VTSDGHDSLTPLPDLPNSLIISAGDTQAFYIKLDVSALRYTNGSNEGNVFAQDENVQILQGVGKSNGSDNKGFGRTYRPRVWNGQLRYDDEIP